MTYYVAPVLPVVPVVSVVVKKKARLCALLAVTPLSMRTTRNHPCKSVKSVGYPSVVIRTHRVLLRDPP